MTSKRVISCQVEMTALRGHEAEGDREWGVISQGMVKEGRSRRCHMGRGLDTVRQWGMLGRAAPGRGLDTVRQWGMLGRAAAGRGLDTVRQWGMLRRSAPGRGLDTVRQWGMLGRAAAGRSTFRGNTTGYLVHWSRAGTKEVAHPLCNL